MRARLVGAQSLPRERGLKVVDLSADYRFDERWYYGLPELTRDRYVGQRRISNPGCYATAMQLAIAPMLSSVICSATQMWSPQSGL